MRKLGGIKVVDICQTANVYKMSKMENDDGLLAKRKRIPSLSVVRIAHRHQTMSFRSANKTAPKISKNNILTHIFNMKETKKSERSDLKDPKSLFLH